MWPLPTPSRTQLTENAKKHEDATVVFYFSGHGSQAGDENGDEGDGIDETLVAYDSRVKDGRDIIDDEVDDWFEDLRRYTSNITFILDSCHSSSANRDLTSIVPRKLEPNPNMKPPHVVTARGGGSKDVGNGLLPRNRQYAALSGSLPEELSNEDNILTPEGYKHHGFLTYYLVDALKRTPDMTYEQAIREIEPAITKLAPSQHPQAEGDTERVVFGGAGDRADPYIRIQTRPQDKTFEIAVGAVHGLQEGAILAVYAPQARKLSGEQDKLANARVLKVGDFLSTAELLDEPKAEISESAKVRIVSLYSGLQPMRVNLGGLPNQDTTTQDRGLLTKVEEALRQNQLVRLTTGSDNWDIAVQRGCLSESKLVVATAPREVSPDACRIAYYLAPSDRDYPLASFWVMADDPKAAAGKLADAIQLLAKQENIRAIDNAVSPLRGKLQTSLIMVDTEKGPDGKPKIVSERAVDAQGSQPIRVGEYLRLKIENQSDYDLYTSVIGLGTSGSIQVHTPTSTGELIKRGQSLTTRPPLRVGPPLGLETFKVIATTAQGVDFRVLEQSGLARSTKDPGTSALEWFLGQATSEKTRDSAAAEGLDLSSWTTDRVDLLIQQ